MTNSPAVTMVPSPVAPEARTQDVGEGQGGGDCRTIAVGIPPTPNPSPQGESSLLRLHQAFDEPALHEDHHGHRRQHCRSPEAIREHSLSTVANWFPPPSWGRVREGGIAEH